MERLESSRPARRWSCANIDRWYTNVYGQMMGFEWDEEKRRSNIEDHKVDFRLAVRIFHNPVIEAADERDDYGEVRIRALGHIDEDYYLVVYTWRGDTRGSLAHGR